jgi:hypothetical protein
MSQQFLSLLLMNRFYPDPKLSTNNGSSSSGLETMGLATASEFLTSQLSYMLSQWSDKFDVEFAIRPGTYNTGQIYEGGLSTSWWNLHANYEVSAENPENMGEFTFDVKLNKSGKLRFKAFNRTNATYLSSPYTQGVGLLFREDFNRLKDLFKRKNSPAIRREDENEIPDNEQVNPNSEKSITASLNDIQS